MGTRAASRETSKARGVAEQIAPEVAQEKFAILLADDVVRVKRNFSSATGGIDNKLRDCIAAGVTTHGGNHVHADVRVRSEVTRTRDGVALVEVIRTDPALQETMS